MGRPHDCRVVCSLPHGQPDFFVVENKSSVLIASWDIHEKSLVCRFISSTSDETDVRVKKKGRNT